MGNFRKLRVWQIAKEINYIENETMENLVNECIIISVMLSKLINARSK